ncbi:hypothetical protein [Alysiella crassa]|uniref:hypothetical protein n=1 Tax=Alysiella crassa TaxID=153491 RepID=UPI0011C034E9|nr:hypothetical protein [Alysiella crassa]UOP05808.1 hypothetical protein LVJ80_07850 [Alysiella crassa]
MICDWQNCRVLKGSLKTGKLAPNYSLSCTRVAPRTTLSSPTISHFAKMFRQPNNSRKCRVCRSHQIAE